MGELGKRPECEVYDRCNQQQPGRRQASGREKYPQQSAVGPEAAEQRERDVQHHHPRGPEHTPFASKDERQSDRGPGEEQLIDVRAGLIGLTEERE